MVCIDAAHHEMLPLFADSLSIFPLHFCLQDALKSNYHSSNASKRPPRESAGSSSVSTGSLHALLERPVISTAWANPVLEVIWEER